MWLLFCSLILLLVSFCLLLIGPLYIEFYVRYLMLKYQLAKKWRGKNKNEIIKANNHLS